MSALARLHVICLLVSRLARTSPLEEGGLLFQTSGTYRHLWSVQKIPLANITPSIKYFPKKYEVRGPSLVHCLFNIFAATLPCLDTIAFISNMETRNAVETRDICINI
jgi:hypothetical protein